MSDTILEIKHLSKAFGANVVLKDIDFSVKKGDVIMILEAMKMENEIFAPVDGTVASVNVTKGTAVDNGTLLCVIA